MSSTHTPKTAPLSKAYLNKSVTTPMPNHRQNSTSTNNELAAARSNLLPTKHRLGSLTKDLSAHSQTEEVTTPKVAQQSPTAGKMNWKSRSLSSSFKPVKLEVAVSSSGPVKAAVHDERQRSSYSEPREIQTTSSQSNLSSPGSIKSSGSSKSLSSPSSKAAAVALLSNKLHAAQLKVRKVN